MNGTGQLYYLAYGSNLHPLRLRQRVPSAELIGVTEIRNHRLAFHKRGRDGSAKADMVPCTGDRASVFVAIYRIEEGHKDLLDRFEGCGRGYVDRPIDVQYQGQRLSCFTYGAQPSYIAKELRPYHWYKDLVVIGARRLGFPRAYIHGLESIGSIEDDNILRREQHRRLIDQMRITGA